MSNKRALIVEDDPSWQDLLAEVLEDCGLTVDTTNTVEEAIALLRSHPYRLATVDLSLAGRDHTDRGGEEVLEAGRLVAPGCNMVLLSGHITMKDAMRYMHDYGAYSCLSKTEFQREELRTLVDRIFATSPETHGSSAPVPATEGKALVVDDDAGWQDLLQEILRDAGFSVQVSASYGEALGLLTRDLAVAVIDLSLQGARTTPREEFEGYRLLERATNSGIPTIVVSATNAFETIERIHEEFDVFAYLEKQGFSRAAFLGHVESLKAQSDTGLSELTPREMEALELLIAGMTNKEIAETMVISANTVKRHLKSIFAKLGVNTRAAAVATAVSLGITPPSDAAD